MKIFSAAQVKKWDAATITNEPITSINLMERAATACYRWILEHNYEQKHFLFFCGRGNNGGDGLAIARLLLQNNCRVTVYIPGSGNKGSDDFEINLQRLHPHNKALHFITEPGSFPEITNVHLVIDALFGTGLNKPPEGVDAALISHINNANAHVISIDLPSGLFADSSSKGNSIVKATHTLSFQHHKLAFLLPENEDYCGEVTLLNIGLNKTFEKETATAFELTDRQLIKSIHRPKKKFSHKGTYGHAALWCGSFGMMGAAVLSARACLRSGAGKLSCYIPKCGYEILQSSIPEAMCKVNGEEYMLSLEDIEKFDAVGIGPGIGLYPTHAALLKDIFQKVNKPMLVDADALNTIAADPSLLTTLPPLSILTPHPKEFERLFGIVSNDIERLQLALQKSKEHNVYIVLKGHYTFISTPEGKGWFNSTGNAGMATAGTGDVLTGFITGLLAQCYPPLQAALLGVYLHGMAGDIAAQKFSPEAMIAGDIVDCLGEAFKQIS